MRKYFISLLGVPLLWFSYCAYYYCAIPNVKISETTSIPIGNEKSIPFYELMSPIPSNERVTVIPKLEYSKGPPSRFVDRLSLSFRENVTDPKERIVFYGRRSQTKIEPGFFPVKGDNRDALFLKAAISYSQTLCLPDYAQSIFSVFYIPFLLHEAEKHLRNVEKVTIMQQTDTPAFFFEYKLAANGRQRSASLFFRRNSLYWQEFIADRNFSVLDPLNLFRKSFLIEKRSDALDFLAQNLSDVEITPTNFQIQDTIWPLVLLVANISLDPSSIESFYHFAGLSTTMFKNLIGKNIDLETLDTLRNNVLAAETYADDIAPQSQRAAEIHRLARALTRNFNQ